MKHYTVKNLTNGQCIGESFKLADTFFGRLKGLLGYNYLKEDMGIIIYPCNVVHTIGMKFAIDVVFVSKDNEVVYLIENMGKRKISPIVKKARYVIELKEGTIARKGIKIGHQISIYSKS